MEIAGSSSQKTFKQASPAMNNQSHALARRWLEDLRRSHPSLSSVNVNNKIYSYILKAEVLLLGVEKRQKASKYCCQTSNGACKTSVIFWFDQGKTKT